MHSYPTNNSCFVIFFVKIYPTNNSCIVILFVKFTSLHNDNLWFQEGALQLTHSLSISLSTQLPCRTTVRDGRELEKENSNEMN